MRYRIDGENLPVLKVLLEQGEAIECEAGAMSWMDNEIQMQTSAGGLGKMFGFTLGERNLQQLSSVSEAYLITQLERGFSTLDFYKSLLI